MLRVDKIFECLDWFVVVAFKGIPEIPLIWIEYIWKNKVKWNKKEFDLEWNLNECLSTFFVWDGVFHSNIDMIFNFDD